MGWSCRYEAGKVMEAWSAACVEMTGSSNEYLVGSTRCFFEASRREHADGAITGTVMKVVPSPPGSAPDSVFAVKCGTFRVEGNGTVTRGPALLKQAAMDADLKPPPLFTFGSAS